MKAEAIVYESNTGFTKKYADLLSEATGLKVYDRREAGKSLKKGTSILYMGWIMAGRIKGFKKAQAKYCVKAAAAVGMSAPADKASQDLVTKYQTEDLPVFYLQGGFDKSKLRGLNKIMMGNVENIIGKKEQKTEAERLMLDVVRNGGDFVKKENLVPIISWMK